MADLRRRERAERARSRGEAVENPGFAQLLWVVIENRATIYPGLVDDDLINLHRTPGIEGQLCLLLTHIGKNDEALTLLEKYVVNRPGIGTYEIGHIHGTMLVFSKLQCSWDTVVLPNFF